MTIALLTALFLSACATTEERAASAGARLGAALASNAAPPPLPDDCRKRERSGVRAGDPLDVALIKTDQALGRANNRVARCAAWNDDYRNSLGRGAE